MRATQQLIEIAGLLHTARVASHRRKIGRGLAIQKPEFAKLVSPQSSQPVLLDIAEQ